MKDLFLSAHILIKSRTSGSSTGLKCHFPEMSKIILEVVAVGTVHILRYTKMN